MKYHNKKTKIKDITFDSKAESKRYIELKLLEDSGLIRDITLQPKFVLQPKFKKNGKTHREISYIADFMYYDNHLEKVVVEDVKGYETEVFKIKRKMFEYLLPELELVLIKKVGKYEK